MIQIMYADLSGADHALDRKLYENASPERRCRADRCLRQTDRLRCLAADALLKAALGRENYRIETNEFGKPRLADDPDFHFNLSHSGDRVVLAYGDTEVGVDVQRHTDGKLEALAKRWFSPGEYAYVCCAPNETRRRFFEIWTARESYGKYLGKGLAADMRDFSVLEPPPGIYILHPDLGKDYSMSLCSTQSEYILTRLDLERL